MSTPLEPWDDDTSFGQLFTDPEGKRFLITGARVYGAGGPAFLVVEGNHPIAERLLRFVNPVLVRLQSPRTEQSARVEVCSVKGKKKLTYLMGLDAEDLDGARRMTQGIGQEITAGVFKPIPNETE